jgi:hypothetical protein
MAGARPAAATVTRGINGVRAKRPAQLDTRCREERVDFRGEAFSTMAIPVSTRSIVFPKPIRES